MSLKSTSFNIVLIFIAFFCGQSNSAQNINKTVKERTLNQQQSLFLQAETALQNHQFLRFSQLRKQLVDYPLLEYLERDRLLQLLAKQSLNTPVKESVRQAIHQFLQVHSNQVVGRKLRHYWLNYLADSKQSILFLDYYQSSYSTKLKCRFLEFRLKKDKAIKEIHPEIKSIWLTGRSLPKSCDPLFTLWKNTGSLSQELIWQRMLLAVDQKQYQLVSYLNRQHSSSNQAAGELLLKIIKHPENLLNTKFSKHINSLERTVIIKGINKLAWKSTEKAIEAWKIFDERLHLTSKQTAKLKRSIGLSLAIEQSPQAKSWLRSLDKDSDTSVDQWLLSTALMTEDWPLIEHLTRQKNRNSIDIDKWRYWRAISTKNSGYPETSDWLMKSLANNRSYYGFLAAIAQNQPPQLNIKPETIDPDIIQSLANKKSAKRAYQFYQHGRLTQARQEWNSLLSGTAPTNYIALAQLAHQWGWNHQSILAFAKSKKIDDVVKRFPFYQKDIYQSESYKQQIPMTWAYAITRQESAFKEDAFSSAGALGLMQLKPSTARQIAKHQAKLTPTGPNPTGFDTKSSAKTKAQLHTPKINISLGIAHLKEMLDYYNGHPILATAAYNAGKHRVDKWLLDNTISDSVLWIEQIPYKETREYVKNVLTYQQIYAQLAESSESFIANLANYPIPTSKTDHTNITAH